MSRATHGGSDDRGVETALFVAAAAIVSIASIASTALGLTPDLVPYKVQLIILLIAVVTLGLPHGALDPWIARQAGIFRRWPGWIAFNLAYMILAAGVLIFWWQLPVSALALFLAISAWHFSNDWANALPVAGRLISAGALIVLPAYFHPEDVNTIFAALSGDRAELITGALQAAGPVVLTGLLGVMAVLAWRQQWSTFLELGAIALLAALTPPLVFFTLYFCLLHSPRHLGQELRAAARPLRPRLLVTAIAYTLATLALGATLAWLLWPTMAGSDVILKLVFIGLAALTVPHMALMVYRNRPKLL